MTEGKKKKEWGDNKHIVRADTRDEGESDVLVVACDAADLLQVPGLALLDKGVGHCAEKKNNDEKQEHHRDKRLRHSHKPW